jgi:predicted DNA-binding transcriptional regulator AlpA
VNQEKISYTEKEVESLTGLRVKTLQRWRLMGKGPRFVRLGGRCVRYPADSLRRWVNSQEGGGSPASAA